MPEGISLDSPSSPAPPPPIKKDQVRTRSTSSTRRRPPPPPKERRRSRGSTLQLVSTNQDLLAPQNSVNNRRAQRKRQHVFLNQLASIKHWFKANAKRAKSPASQNESSTINSLAKTVGDAAMPKTPKGNTAAWAPTVARGTSTRPLSGSSYVRPQMPTSKHRSSLSPAPITPRSSYRLSSGSGGLRGRKSTSSSVSSIRSIHRLPSHSKASSTSSTANSVHSSTPYSKSTRSPHPSVRVLPLTPTVGSFPSNIRLVRATPTYNESAHFNSSTGLVFAKRKKTPLRGPRLTAGTNATGALSPRHRDSSASGSRSASAAGRASGEIIEEEEEDIEEVDAFSPVAHEFEEISFGAKG